MTSVILQRVLAVILLLIAFLALAASKAFPFLDDIPGVAKSAIAVAGAACGLTGVWLWLRKTPDQP
ncbi:hypothetical protein BDK92_6618 [Micromonospora pisi]|uniref:Uncharacterized protein n=1 Tax=Micromonospora pisi TaxID=589240 RepID=A0A495JV30_9ACTN|nr:hypothetical protein [Micromonospora pisi]RKR92184.1 hypothetical protein BDK92_6618 [Micromonospora pisi]